MLDSQTCSFEQADTDKDGFLTRDEFFFWALEWATLFSGGAISGIEEMFRKFDSSGDGELNLLEFVKVLDHLGFGSKGPEIFMQLDKEGDGKISYMELLKALKSRRGEYSCDAQRLLVTMAFDMEHATDQDLGGDVLAFDTSPWRQVETPEDVRAELRNRMNDELARPFDLWGALLAGVPLPRTTRTLSADQFKKGMTSAFGFALVTAAAAEHSHPTSTQREVYRAKSAQHRMAATHFSGGSKHSPLMSPEDVLLSQVFGEMDAMSQMRDAGTITYEDFLGWLNGNVEATKRVLALSFCTRPRKLGVDPPLHEIDWTPELLRFELQTMLLGETPPLSPLDLMFAHDRSEDGNLNRKEFIVMMKKLVGSEQAWGTTNVKDVVIALFERIAGADAELSIEELQAWISRGWMRRKAELAHEKASALKGLLGGRAMTIGYEAALEELARIADAQEEEGTGAGEEKPKEAEKTGVSATSVRLYDNAVSTRNTGSTRGGVAAACVTPRGPSIHELFHLLDADADGSISENEAKQAAQQLGCNPATFWSLLLKYDVDGDRVIQMDEFEQAIKGRVFSAFFPNMTDMELAREIQRARADLSRALPGPRARP